MKRSNPLLVLGALLVFAFAVFQIAIGIVPAWSAFWGAGDALVSNRPLLLGSSLVVAVLCGVAGLYALSGAGLVRRLPLLRTGLLVIGLVSMLRGIAFVLLLLTALGMLPSQGPIPGTAWWSSFWFLLISLSYLGGLAYGWRSLRRPAPQGDRFAPAR